MKALARLRSVAPVLAGFRGRLIPLVITAAFATGCDYPFEPIQKPRDAVFSMFGYLDLKADTQWIRVMPIRERLLLEPAPIDAVVTLEHVGTGRTVTLTDSLFSFPVRELDSVAYAYNFWTAEPLEPGATYRLRAERSDGASATASIVMPPDLTIDFLSGPGFGTDNALLLVRAEHLLYVDLFYAMIASKTGERAQSVTIRQDQVSPGDVPGTYRVFISGAKIEPAGFLDLFRREIRLTAATSDWPFHPDLSDQEVSLPGEMPSNVENGLGFVGGVAEWTVPLHRCQVLAERPGGGQYCENHFNRQSASVYGRVMREPCGEPHTLMPVRLTERFVEGGAVIRTWATGWEGEYRFEGVEPGAELVLDLGPDTPSVTVPPLAPGERYFVDDMSVAGWC